MGQYLSVGIAKEIVVRKKDIFDESLTVELIEHSLNETEKICTEFYDFNEDENYLCWELKEKVFDDDFRIFHKKILQMYDPKIPEVLGDFKDSAEIKKFSNQNANENFSSCSMPTYISLVDKEGAKVYNRGDADIDAMYGFLSFLHDGKILMECYRTMFRFLEKNIRTNFREHPVSKILKVMIIG